MEWGIWDRPVPPRLWWLQLGGTSPPRCAWHSPFTSQEILTFLAGKGKPGRTTRVWERFYFSRRTLVKIPRFFCSYRTRPYFWCLEFSQGWLRRLLASEMLCHVLWWKCTDVSEELAFSWWKHNRFVAFWERESTAEHIFYSKLRHEMSLPWCIDREFCILSVEFVAFCRV